MFSLHLEHHIISEDSLAYEAFWRLSHGQNFHTILFRGQDICNMLLVVDNKEIFLGVLCLSEFIKCAPFTSSEMENLHVNEIYNRNASICLYHQDPEIMYQKAAYTFSLYPNKKALPVIDNDKNILDIITQNQVFYQQRYNEKKLPRMHYARSIYNAAILAKNLKYNRMSVLEFGVAAGHGLLNLEFHAREC